MFYWLTKYSAENFIELLRRIMKNLFKDISTNSLDQSFCFLQEKKKFIHSMIFNYVQIRNAIPYSITIVNYTDFYDFLLVTFNKEKLQKNGDPLKQCDQIKTRPIPYAFYCRPSNLNNIEGILFFKEYCYFLRSRNCTEILIRSVLSDDQGKVDQLFQNNRKESKFCGFENAKFLPHIIDYTTIKGNRLKLFRNEIGIFDLLGMSRTTMMTTSQSIFRVRISQ